ncbi:MAG: hypothetical protein LYZ70_04185 [Nitrososphaerales archaeon]|nr:hypothetical protein [Nitrososphaerales archaeon]
MRNLKKTRRQIHVSTRSGAGPFDHTFSTPNNVLDLVRGWLWSPDRPYTLTISEGKNGGKKHLFLFDLEVRDGGNEYLQYGVVEAYDEKRADRIARKKAAGFLGSKMKWTDHDTLEPADNGEYRMVEYNGVQEMSAEEILRRLMW